MWEVKGETNRIYLLGPVHLLRQSDYPIPTVIYSVYDQAETLIMELDMDDMDAIQLQSLIFELGMNGDGRTLEDAMGQASFAQASTLAEELGIPLPMMARSKPWYAAMTAEILLLTRVGFDPSHGVESHFMARAVADGKEIRGLETERQQLEMLDNLSLDAQREMLLQVLTEGASLEDVLDNMINAWRHGDTAYMKNTLLGDMQGHRELYETIVVDRNRDWVLQLQPLLDDADDYLVIVGALHLVGSDGVPQLLKVRGLDVQQMNESANDQGR